MTTASPAKSLSPIDTQTWMRAVDAGDTALVESLLAAGADVNAATDGGQTALIRATTRGYLNVVRVLLDAGADVNAKKDNGATALIVAVFLGYADIVRLLLARGADPSAQTAQGTTAEKWAHAIGFTEIVGLLRNADAIRAEAIASEGATARKDEALSATQNSEAAEATAAATLAQSVAPATFFPAEGAFRPVVPLSEINEASAHAETEIIPFEQDVDAGVAAHETVEVAAQELAAHEVGRDERAPTEQTEQDEATLVPAHEHAAHDRPVVTTAPHIAPVAVAARTRRGLQSWQVIALSLALLVVVGVALDAQWKRSRRAGRVAETNTTPRAADAATAPANTVETQAIPQPQAAMPQAAEPLQNAPDAGVALSAPVVTAGAGDATNPTRTRIDTSETASSPSSSIAPSSSNATSASASAERRREPVVVAETPARRSATAESSERRTTPAPVVRERENASEAVRREARPPVARSENADDAVQRSTSPDLSLPVFSQKPSGKSDKKKVIQWP